jgi:ketosteroid isomerase-like protein
MTEHSLWRFSRALRSALDERQTDQLEAILDDNVEWAIYGPIDMFAFLGVRRGKQAVIEVVREIAAMIRFQSSERESIMLCDDTAASLMRYSITTAKSNKPISIRLAHFAQFKAGRLVSLRAVIDTFDLVEQTIGRHIHLPKIA